MIEIVFASSNEHKILEINQIASGFGFKFSAPDIGFDPIENGNTFEENAIIKAKEASRVEKSGRKFFLSDDSGLCLDALNGAPGINSARYAPTNNERIELVLKNLEGKSVRDAQFVCSMALVDDKGNIMHITEGICKGKIAPTPCGEGGFGYDPIFIPNGYEITLAEVPQDEKNAISHRGKALRDMLIYAALALK